ncbi:MAG: 4-(cytidine 5'-diphospho)-2-C-methyl-D-erythritol kinase [Lachnospiraceae bacterium]|nr:4-(cytidine 5'-diphospho)-2-C-methyl-D-erythritol kinase [Lachnospiraceae bacterium]
MDQITRKAYAKINLGLDVIRRRPDGYHEVKMIMQTVGICDILTFRKSGRQDGAVTLFLDKKELPCGKENLVYRAAELLTRTHGLRDGVEITLEKRIPIAAGMAGGSTDAAAVFHGMNELFGLSMSLQEMKDLGVGIGADVPYCIQGGTALSEGIGEILTALPSPPAAYLLIAKPDISVSTKFVYENLHADRLQSHPDIDGMVQALERGSLEGIVSRMENVLETVTVREYPVIQTLKDIMRREGALNALMSGSGPTVFGVYKTREAAEASRPAVEKSGMAKEIFVTEFV